MELIFAGDSWALKGFTPENYHFDTKKFMPGDIRLADYWPVQYFNCLTPGQGNLSIMDKILTKQRPDLPIIWIWTEPGRDYGRVTGDKEFAWMTHEHIWETRREITRQAMIIIRQNISNPIGLIGGLSDIECDLAEANDFYVIHPSWQKWIAEKLHSKWFNFGWGASDIGWRANYNTVTPSKSATFAWDEQIKEWCWWEDQGYFYREHPTPLANKEFAIEIWPTIKNWLENEL